MNLNKIKFMTADIVSAFSKETVGTKILNETRFLEILEESVRNYDNSNDRVKGQHFVMLPKDALECVSAGVGRRTKNPENYIARLYRGNVELFLKRKLAAKVEGCACVVYTKEAYLKNPDVLNDKEEMSRIQSSDATHVIVAPLAFAGPQAPPSAHRFVQNLAGGNRETETYSVEDILSKAKQIKVYWDKWCTVAD